MKLKKIMVIVISIFTIFNISNCYAVNVPSANASPDKIKEYINENGASGISIATLVKWYKTVSSSITKNDSSDSKVILIIDRELKAKTNAEVEQYCKDKTSSDLQKDISLSILEVWNENINNIAIKETVTQSINSLKDKRDQEAKDTTLSTSTIDPNDFEPDTNSYSDSKAVEKAEKIIGAIQAVGSLISVGALVYIGIRYMIGSTEEKAMYKETMLPYLVGAILVFLGSNIVGAIYNAIK